jgi:exodeoxyribonuclease VII large subunit
MQVLARGRISLYEPRGEYQFIVDSLQEAGIGLLQQQFEALKKKLEAEGLFAADRKQALPRFPLRIGVITSPSGAVIRDILHVLQRRWPVADVRLYASPVQGNDAPAALGAALSQANREAWAEVLIIARGGGSLEDLHAFNDESVARRVADSAIPVISAVGHETDYSICDFVADQRAPTPSAAAEIATPDGPQLLQGIERSRRQLGNRMLSRLQQHSQQLDHLAHRLAQQHPQVKLRLQGKDLSLAGKNLLSAMQRNLQERMSGLSSLSHRLGQADPGRKLVTLVQRVNNAQDKLHRSTLQVLQRSRGHLHELGRTLNAVSPLATLDRGYAVLSDAASGSILTSCQGVNAGQKLQAQLVDGRLELTVDGISQETLLGEEWPGKSDK